MLFFAKFEQVVNKYENNNITGIKKFDEIIIEGNLICSTINEINLEEIENKALKKAGAQIIEGHLTFQEVHIQGRKSISTTFTENRVYGVTRICKFM